MYDLLNEHVEKVELVHAKGVRAIANAAVKTDQIDASVLAHLARMNYIPKAYAASKKMRDLRQLLRHREWMVNQRSKAKNRIHAVLAAYNLVSPVTDLFGVAGREYLHEMMDKELRPAARQVVADHLALLDHLGERIRSLEKGISLNEQQEHIVRLLMMRCTPFLVPLSHINSVVSCDETKPAQGREWTMGSTGVCYAPVPSKTREPIITA